MFFIFIILLSISTSLDSLEVKGIIDYGKKTSDLSEVNFSKKKKIKVRFQIFIKNDTTLEINAFESSNTKSNLLKTTLKKGNHFIPNSNEWIEIDIKDEVKLEFIDKNKKKIVYFKKFDPISENFFEKKYAGTTSVKASINKIPDIALLEEKLPPYKYTKTRNSGVEIFEKYSSSVVFILAKSGFGSGSIIDEKGTILTNWHVIDGLNTVKIFQKPGNFEKIDENKAILADVVKYNQTLDLAILKMRKIPININPIKLGNKDELKIASNVHAIGHPQGNSWSYTKGTISQIRPDYEWSYEKTLHKADTIQTQTPISPGNSGGPLLNKNGELIGVNSFILDGKSQNINYAVSISSIKPFIKNDDKFIKAKMIDQYGREINETMRLVDIDQDGYRETLGIDSNNDGVPDIIKIDVNKDGKFDEIHTDLNFDGELDGRSVFIKMQNGEEIVVIETDTNKDGIIDEYDHKGADYNLDGKIDEIIPGIS